MARLTRVEQQRRTSAAVLAAAKAEFSEYGYVEAKVDRIAERAELTRGAVYSNFPSKRALYLAVLAEMDERTAGGVSPRSPASVALALGAFARVCLERLPLVEDTPAEGHLHLRSLTGVIDDEPTRAVLAQVTRLEALLLALALERTSPRRGRQVRLAELVVTLLSGSRHLAETAPGFGDPFDVARACQQLAEISLPDAWDPPYLPYIPPPQACLDAWAPPAGLTDLLTGRLVDAEADGVVVVLGSRRLEATEEALRAAGRGEQVTVAVVTSDPAATGRLVRVRVGDFIGCLTRVFPPDTWSPLRLVLDEGAALASTLGVPAADATEAAVRIRDGAVVARAAGQGAAHAAAAAADRPL